MSDGQIQRRHDENRKANRLLVVMCIDFGEGRWWWLWFLCLCWWAVLSLFWLFLAVLPLSAVPAAILGRLGHGASRSDSCITCSEGLSSDHCYSLPPAYLLSTRVRKNSGKRRQDNCSSSSPTPEHVDLRSRQSTRSTSSGLVLNTRRPGSRSKDRKCPYIPNSQLYTGKA